MLSEKIRTWLGPEAQIELTADLAHGDFTTNRALVLGKKEKRPALEAAKDLVAEWEKSKPPEIAEIKIAGAGFINFYLSPEWLRQNLKEVLKQKEKFGWNQRLAGQKIIVEYTDPNPFKELHLGHLMSNAIGEAISRLVEAGGAEVRRACYSGDVGLHVAKAVWAGGDYVLGARKYDEDEQAKKDIQGLNRKIYLKNDPEINRRYELGRKKSLEQFERIYRKLGTKFDYYFFESETGALGKKTVEENAGKIFERSDGAVVFRAEKYDPKLHTRVFINTESLPTYEAKELGLAKLKYEQYPYDQSIIITGNEVNQYFKVLLRALELVFPALAAKTKHLSHGMLRLPSGKMSSRTGEIIAAETLLEEIGAKVKEKSTNAPVNDIAVAAVKYQILKQAPGRDAVFDINQSISLTGDSGPYLQYTGVRARSVLAKAGKIVSVLDGLAAKPDELLRLLSRFPEVVSRASSDYAPQHLVTYLLALAGAFNHYYAENQIIGSAEESYRLALTAAAAQVIDNGLWLLGIKMPERM